MVDCIFLYVIAIKEEKKKKRLICKGIIVQITSTFKKKYKSIRKRRLDRHTSSRYMLTPDFYRIQMVRRKKPNKKKKKEKLNASSRHCRYCYVIYTHKCMPNGSVLKINKDYRLFNVFLSLDNSFIQRYILSIINIFHFSLSFECDRTSSIYIHLSAQCFINT